MTNARIVCWILGLVAAAVLYVVSVIVTGQHTQNGPWALLMLVLIGAGVDLGLSAFRGKP